MIRFVAWTLAVLAFCVTVAWPVTAFLLQGGEATSYADTSMQSPGRLWLTTVVWCTGIALASTLLGWGPARLLAARTRCGRGAVLLILILLPIVLPGYAVFSAWWQMWPADSALHAWLVSVGGLSTARWFTLALALIAWSWPIACLCTVPMASTWSSQRTDQLAIDGASMLQRLGQRLRHDAGGLLLGFMLVWMLVFANTTCFDLAGIYTVSNELRAMAALGAAPMDLLPLAWPAWGLACIVSIALWWCLRLPESELQRAPARVRPVAWFAFGLLWCISYLLPSLLQWLQAGVLDWSAYLQLYGDSLLMALGRSILVGGIALVPLWLLVRLWSEDASWMRWTATILSIGWIVCAFIPGTMLGQAFEAAWNRSDAPAVRSTVHATGLGLLLALSARTAIVPVLLARWVVRSEPEVLRSARRLESGGGRSLLEAQRPRLVIASVATVSMCAALALGDIPLAAMVAPPAAEPPLAVSLLNAMHYQRPDTVVMTLAALLVVGLIAAVVTGCVVGMWHRRLRTTIVPILLLSLVLFPPGCGSGDDSPGADTLEIERSFGRPGRGPGQFVYPRALAVDRERGIVYVVDKTARIQAFDREGTWLRSWTMPAFENGKPTGLAVGPGGNVFVADTHEFRVIEFTPEGEEVARFGTFGQEPGAFTYPTDVAFGPDGAIYVSEYGGNDRIQVFEPGGELRSVLGRFGEEPGEFNRPQAMVLSPDGTHLYVADSCNHRIQVLTPEGEVIRIIGEAGRTPGSLHYPYDLALLDDGTLLVSEFGSSRVQQFDAQGRWLGAWGSHGYGPTELNAPWSIDHDGRSAYILDSGNDRVQVIDVP
ncbi:MAG: hypothetical protein P8K80_11510 [Phycisphaerales bacterium]|nr:hypothetical protein [Phycisphaerales bacterium]